MKDNSTEMLHEKIISEALDRHGIVERFTDEICKCIPPSDASENLRIAFRDYIKITLDAAFEYGTLAGMIGTHSEYFNK